MKFCSSCNTIKKLSEFHKRGDGPGFRSNCILCTRISNNRRYKKSERQLLSEQEIKENRKKACKKYNSTSKRRALQANYEARRRALKLKACPKWLSTYDKEGILVHYELAKLLSIYLGTKMEVDHIIPLRGINVSGLHVPWNLQIMAKEGNMKKGNRLEI